MADYRLYLLDGAGKIGLADWIQATDDEDAIGKARQVRPNAHKCEVWQRDRLVAKLSAEGHSQRIDGWRRSALRGSSSNSSAIAGATVTVLCELWERERMVAKLPAHSAT